MTDKRISAAGVASMIAIAITAGVFAWETLPSYDYGALDIAVGAAAGLYWAAVSLWILCVAFVIWRRRRWLILCTAPIVLYPAAVLGLIFNACLMGDCI